jgi:hypothetical protein
MHSQKYIGQLESRMNALLTENEHLKRQVRDQDQTILQLRESNAQASQCQSVTVIRPQIDDRSEITVDIGMPNRLSHKQIVEDPFRSFADRRLPIESNTKSNVTGMLTNKLSSERSSIYKADHQVPHRFRHNHPSLRASSLDSHIKSHQPAPQNAQVNRFTNR